MRPLVVDPAVRLLRTRRLGGPSLASLLADDRADRFRQGDRIRHCARQAGRSGAAGDGARGVRFGGRGRARATRGSSTATIARRRSCSQPHRRRATRRATPRSSSRCSIARRAGRRRAADLRRECSSAGHHVHGSCRPLPRGARRARAQPRSRSQHVLSRRRTRRRRSRDDRNRVGPALSREGQPARSAEVLSGGAAGRRVLGARARRPRARPRGRGSAEAAEAAAERASQSIRTWPMRISCSPALHLDADRDDEAREELDKVLAFNPSQPRGALDARGDGLRAGRHRPASTRSREGARDQSVVWRGLPRRRPSWPRSNYRFDEAVALAREGAGARSDRTPRAAAISACS